MKVIAQSLFSWTGATPFDNHCNFWNSKFWISSAQISEWSICRYPSYDVCAACVLRPWYRRMTACWTARAATPRRPCWWDPASNFCCRHCCLCSHGNQQPYRTFLLGTHVWLEKHLKLTKNEVEKNISLFCMKSMMFNHVGVFKVTCIYMEKW